MNTVQVAAAAAAVGGGAAVFVHVLLAYSVAVPRFEVITTAHTCLVHIEINISPHLKYFNFFVGGALITKQLVPVCLLESFSVTQKL